MNKIVVMIVVLAVVGVGGWFGFQAYQTIQAQRAEKARAAAVQARAAADEKKYAAAQVAAKAAADTLRKDVEAQLKPMKISSLMPGQPGLVIIDKKEYAEGDPLLLPRGGKTLQVTQVREDGVLLALNGMTFRLAAPATVDLDIAGRK